MDVNINDMWMEESVKVIQWKNTNEKTNTVKPALHSVSVPDF